MSSNLLNKKIPYFDSFTSNEDAFNYMAKELNAARQKQSSGETVLNLSKIDGVTISQSWSSGSSGTNATYTFNHNLGSIPSGFIVIDKIMSPIAGNIFPKYEIIRTGWTTTQISVRVICDTDVAGSSSGSFKLLILR